MNRNCHAYEGEGLPPQYLAIHAKDTTNRDTTRAAFRIRYLAPAIWNDIPAGIREAEHIGSFKVKFKNIYWEWGDNFFLFLIIVILYFVYSCIKG